MTEVWPDTFVEDAGLTRNIPALRKALGPAPPPVASGTPQTIVVLPFPLVSSDARRTPGRRAGRRDSPSLDAVTVPDGRAVAWEVPSVSSLRATRGTSSGR